MRKFIYISLLLLLSLKNAQAQKNLVDTVTEMPPQEERVVQAPVEETSADSVNVISTIETFTEPVSSRPVDTSLYRNTLPFSYDSIIAWRNSKDFAYIKKLDSLLKKEKKRPVQEAEKYEPRSGILGSGVLQLLLWTFAVCFVLFILYRLFIAEGVFKRKVKTTANNEAAVEAEEITQESDFDALIRQALQRNNYRQAVRYQYLRTLHLLAAKGLVSLAPDKTNFNYVTEITNPETRNAFAALTLNYEYAWYGEFEVDRDIYERIEQNFSNLNKKI